jgi:hypothetical protein
VPLTDSPSLERDGTTKPSTTSKRTEIGYLKQISRLRWLIFMLIILDVFLAGFGLLSPGYGNVVGSVRDLEGMPLQAEVFIVGMPEKAQTDAQGQFFIPDVSSGTHVLTINYLGNIVTFEINVPKGGNFRIGQIQIVADD